VRFIRYEVRDVDGAVLHVSSSESDCWETIDHFEFVGASVFEVFLDGHERALKEWF